MNSQKAKYWQARLLKKLQSRSSVVIVSSLILGGMPFFFIENRSQKFENMLTRQTEKLSQIKIPTSLRHILFSWYAKKYDVDLKDLQKPLVAYPTFSAFFTRKIKSPSINWEQTSKKQQITSPAQGTILSISQVDDLNNAFIVKGINYSIRKLLYGKKDKYILGQSESKASQISKLKILTNSKLYQVIIYLSPGNYHRFHSPIDLEVTASRSIVGKFKRVNLQTLLKEKGSVYEENARKILECRYVGPKKEGKKEVSKYGKVYLGLIGAMNVSNIIINKKNTLEKSKKAAVDQGPKKQNQFFKQGQEIGYFNLGSTIVLLIQATKLDWKCKEGQKIRYGDVLCEPTS